MRIDLPHVHSGKVRDIYEIDSQKLLMVTSEFNRSSIGRIEKRKKPACVIGEIVEGSHQVEILR